MGDKLLTGEFFTVRRVLEKILLPSLSRLSPSGLSVPYHGRRGDGGGVRE